MHIAVSGSSGLIGSALMARLKADGHHVRRLVRGVAGAGEVAWDPAGGTVDEAALAGTEAMVHLAGEGIGRRRWSAEQKRRIRDSRVTGTTTLCQALARLDPPPSVLVSGSAVGWYGDRGEEELNEDSAPGTGFLAEVCRDWEAATAPADAAGVRVVHIRTGVVQSPAGGALAKQLPLFRLGLGGPLGRGRQYQSWISLDDEVGAIIHALTTPSLSGPVNLVAPNPVTGADFARSLGRVLHRPAMLSVPRAAMAVPFGRELVAELLSSQRALPKRLEASGYVFAHPELEGALRHLLGR
ncbi:MAG: TIGR01777 family oxidoreductase [Acidimicrobiales bacterium]